MEYPASSPFVTTLGGTATYISKTAGGSLTFNQTAWSNIGFVPYFQNLGGGGGGVSIIEPLPWYQSSLQVPASYPNGRLTPDISLDSSGAPGTLIIYQGYPMATGGTSEASPLFAGLLTLVMGAKAGALGLVNPALYQLAGNPKTYQTAFMPVTFGYTIPWVSKFGYNLATGWGAPNIGQIARLYGSADAPSPTLRVDVGIVNPGKTNFTDFTQGQKINVVASVSTASGSPVTTGSFSASLETLGRASQNVTLTYSPAQNGWVGAILVGNQSGVAYVNVAGTSGASQSGQGFAPTFVGYLANFVQPLAPFPWTFVTGLEAAISITDLFGKNPAFLSTPVAFNSYSILTNTYKPVGSAVLNYSNANGYYIGLIQMKLPDGLTTIVTQGGVVGYLPFVSGISLLGTAIYPEVVAEPGSIAPGQALTIVATLTAPENIFLTMSLATGTTLGATIAQGANVTATLVDPSGQTLETVTLPQRTCAQALRVCGAGLKLINGLLPIPTGASPGLYTVLLNARYNDETTGHNYTGSYFGQVYVSGGLSVPKISVSPSTLFEGQTASITASITSPNGNEVTKGLYTALFYPKTAQGAYSSLMHSTYAAFSLIQLSFNAKLNLWGGNATMPSPYNSAVLSTINANAEYYGGPYEVFVSGVSADGVPTAAALSAQQDFFLQPYVYTANSVMTKLQQTSRVAFSNVTINAGSSPLTLGNDYFVGTNTVTGSNVTILSSMVSGTLNLQGGQTTFAGVTGGDIVASNTRVVLQHSALVSLRLGSGATASIDPSSSFQSITPALVVLALSSPVANTSYTGKVNAQVAIEGGGVSGLSFFLDGKQLPSLQGGAPAGPQVAYPLDTTSLPDGTHTLTVVAVQTDLLTSTAAVSFITHNQLQAVANELAVANSTIHSLNGSLSAAKGSIAALQAQIASENRTIDNLTYLAYVAIAAAAVGVVLGAYAMRGKAAWKY